MLDSPFIEKGYKLYNIMLQPIGAQGGDQLGILRFMKEMLVYKWLPLVNQADPGTSMYQNDFF